MKRSIRVLGIVAVCGACASLAQAQAQNDRQPGQQGTQPGQQGTQPGQQGTQPGQPGTQPGDRTDPNWRGGQQDSMWQDEDQSNWSRDIWDQYYGQAGDRNSAHYRLSELAGRFRLTVTKFETDSQQGQAAGQGGQTMQGFAERRWALNGTQLVEFYTIGSSMGYDLPLRQPRSGGLNGMGERRDGVGGLDRNNPAGNIDRNDPNNQNRDNERQSDGLGANEREQDRTPHTDPFRDNINPDDNDRNRTDPNRRNDQNEDENRGREGWQDGQRGDDQNWQDGQRRDDQNWQDGQRRDGQNWRDGGMNQAGQGGMHQQKQGIVLWGYNRQSNEFNVAWTDSSTSAIRYDTGRMENNKLTLEGTYVDPKDNQEYNVKTVLQIESPDRQVLTMYRDGGVLDTESKVLEIVYTRDGQRPGLGDTMRRDERFRNEPDINNRNNTNNPTTPGTTPRR